MIDEALDFLVLQLNEYFKLKTDEDKIVKMQRLVTGAGAEVPLTNLIAFQLINVEEERIGKAQLPVTAPVGSGFPVRNPEIKLNLSILLTACGDNDGNSPDTDYSMSVKLLSLAVLFFQHKHVFTQTNSPSLPSSIEQLIVELYPVSLENQNYLWASLGAKYRPSVVYKVRLITVFEEGFSDFVEMPRNIDIGLANR